MAAINIQIVGQKMLAAFTHRMFFACLSLMHISVLIYFTRGSVRSFTNALLIYLRTVHI